MIIGHSNYRSYDEVMIKLAYDEFVTIYDHHNIFRKYGHWCFLLAYLNVHYLIFCLWFINMHISCEYISKLANFMYHILGKFYRHAQEITQISPDCFCWLSVDLQVCLCMHLVKILEGEHCLSMTMLPVSSAAGDCAATNGVVCGKANGPDELKIAVNGDGSNQGNATEQNCYTPVTDPDSIALLATMHEANRLLVCSCLILFTWL